MVTYILWTTAVGGLAAGVAYSAAAPPPPHPSCSAARDLLLYHYWLAKLATRDTALLVHFRDSHRSHYWL